MKSFISALLAIPLAVVAVASCRKPISYQVPAPHCSVWKSNGKITSVTAQVEVVKPEKKIYHALTGAFFRVWADDKIVWASDCIKEGSTPISIDVPLEGARTIILETLSPTYWCDVPESEVIWKDVTFNGGKGARIKQYKSKSAFGQLGILTPKPKDEPRINGADIWGVHPGHPVLFRVAATGLKPLKFKATSLPEGMTFDERSGIFGGTAPATAGNYDVTVTVSNDKGSDRRVIRFAVGDTLALTPPMGWNSWNIWENMLTAEHAKAAADAMENSGLAGYGWSYINLDDFWERNNSGEKAAKEREEAYGAGNITGATRDADGRIIPNSSFPDMKGLTDHIHSYGFKSGLYSSPGPLTCGKCEGSYGHEAQDAQSWAEWGFDYIKYDCCSLRAEIDKKLAGRPEDADAEYAKAFKLMTDAVKTLDRDMVVSINPGAQQRKGAAKWAREIGVNCWRSWGDLKDSWSWLQDEIEAEFQGEFWKYSGPGCWADPDMLVVGTQKSFGSTHPTILTPNEQYTHISIWAMVSAPLLIGSDMTALDDFTFSLLTNPEIIAINQDRLGKVARRYVRTDCENVWARPLANGDWAVALENLYPMAREISFDLSTIGLDGKFSVLDCWTGRDAGTVSTTVSANVPAHATTVFRLSRSE